jgi:O-antigen/teichoic acid export membrane protein
MGGSRFSRDVLWNVASLGVAGVGGVAVNSLVGASYGAAALGVFNQVFAVYLLFSQIAALGVHGSVIAHLPAVADAGERRAALGAALGVTAALALIVACLFVAITGPVVTWDSAEVALGMRWAAPGLVCFALNKVVLAALNALQRMRAYAVFQAGRVVLMGAGLLGCLALQVEATTLPVILTVSEAITLVLALGALRDQRGPVARPALARWARTHLAFGVRGFLSGLFGELNTRIDVLILGGFASNAVVGVYSLAALIAEGMYQLLIALRTNYAPIVVRLWAAGETDELTRVLRRARNRTYAGAAALAAVAVLGYAVLVPVVTRDAAFAASWPYFAILLAGMVTSAGYVPFNQILLWAHRPGLHTWMIATVVVLGALANLVLVGGAGMAALGAAIATAATYALSTVVQRLFMARALQLRV